MDKTDKTVKKRRVNLYMLISFLFFVFAIELFYYFYTGVDNFLERIPIKIIKNNVEYVSYIILILVLTAGTICGIGAIREKTWRKLCIFIFSLNLLGFLSACTFLGITLYQNHKEISIQNGEEDSANMDTESGIFQTERISATEMQSELPAGQMAQETEQMPQRTEKMAQETEQSFEQSMSEEEKNAEFVSTVLNEVDRLVQEGDLEEAKSILSQTYNITQNSEIQKKINELNEMANSAQNIESEKNETANAAEEKEDIEVIEAAQTNIHSYGFSIQDGTWEDSYRACLQEGGHLVTFETAEEYDYVCQVLQQLDDDFKETVFFIGARRDLGSSQYYWVDTTNSLTGDVLNRPDAWNVNCWLHDEPSFEDASLGVQEHVLSMFYYDDIGEWVWNDVPNGILDAVPYYSGKLGYICEYEN